MFYAEGEICICECGYKDVVENLKIDASLLCPRCPKCNELMLVQEIPAEYDFDSLHIEIDKDASERKMHPFEALEAWQLGVERWEKKYNKSDECSDGKDIVFIAKRETT